MLRRARLVELRKRPDLNGRSGVILGPARADGRVPFRLDSPDEQNIWLQPANLQTEHDVLKAVDTATAKSEATPNSWKGGVALLPTMETGQVLVEHRIGRGRCVVAAVPLPQGSAVPVISGRAAWASCLLPSQRKARCVHCFALHRSGSRVGSLIPCERCEYVRYCSAACREADKLQHGRQCAALADPFSELRSLEAATRSGNLGRLGAVLLAGRCLWRRQANECECRGKCGTDAKQRGAERGAL